MSHKDMSPSSLSRRLLCPGSYQQELGMPELPSSAGDYGTDMHSIWERLITSVELAQEYIQEMKIADKGDISTALEWSDELLDKHRPTVPHEVKVEHKLDLKFIGCRELSNGTADVLMFERFGDGLLVDWKFGNPMVPQEVLEWQLKAYAIGAMQEFGLKTIKGIVAFPKSKKEVVVLYEATYLDEYARQIKEIEARCFLPSPPLSPGHYQCSRCRAIGTCPAMQKIVLDAGNMTSPNVLKNPDRFPEMLDVAVQQQKYEKYIIKRAMDMLRSGAKIKNWRLENAGTPEWRTDVNFKEFLDFLKTTKGYTREAVYTKTGALRSISVVAKHMSEAGVLDVEEILKPYTKPGGKEQLVKTKEPIKIAGANFLSFANWAIPIHEQ